MAKDLIQIDGFRDLQRKLERLGQTAPVRRALIPVLKSVARPTLAAAKQGAPIGTRVHHRYSGGSIAATYYPGNLRKSLGILTVKDRKNAAIIVAIRAGKKRKYDGYYGAFVEEGTVNMPAQPFMGPAFRKTKGKVTKDGERRAAIVIQKQINKLGL